MNDPVELSSVIPESAILGEDETDRHLTLTALKEAESYLKTFRWCPPISSRYFGCGVAGKAAVFLFKFAAKIQNTDEYLWVVHGDIPPAYLVVDNAPTPTDALSIYCDLMSNWIAAIQTGTSLANLFPVSAAPTREHANMLESRITFIRDEIIPNCQKRFPPTHQ